MRLLWTFISPVPTRAIAIAPDVGRQANDAALTKRVLHDPACRCRA